MIRLIVHQDELNPRIEWDGQDVTTRVNCLTIYPGGWCDVGMFSTSPPTVVDNRADRVHVRDRYEWVVK